MKIEFYHIDAFEIANYEPIWRQLREMGVDANLVAVPGDNNTAAGDWFDYNRFNNYCQERKIPFNTEVDPSATIGVTTQNATILAEYRYRVRLMYGPVIYPPAWALQPHAVKPFNAVLTHGKAYSDRFAAWLRQEQLPIIGYPRYDDFFSGQLKPEIIRKKWGINGDKPVLAFLPTWGENTGLEKFFPALSRLAEEYQVILRPHHCTLRMEPQRMAMLESSGLLILNSAFDLSEVYAIADVILADVRSGGFFESCMCDIPTVGMVVDPAEITGWLEQNSVGLMASLCHDPEQLRTAIDYTLSSNHQSLYRQRWADEHVAFRDGSAAEQAAKALIKLAMSVSQPKYNVLTPMAVTETNFRNN